MVRIAGLVLGLWLLVAGAPVRAEPTLAIVDFGEVAGREGNNDNQVATSNGDAVRLFENASVIRHTDHIVARLCRRFGVLYRATNLAPGEVAVVTIRAEHPALMHPDGRVSTGTTYPHIIGGGSPGYVGFTFDEPWELAEGTWSFAVVLGDKVLAEQRFEVTLPKDGGRPKAGACEAPIS